MRLGRLFLSGGEEQCVFLDEQSAVLLKDVIPAYDGSYLTNELISSIQLSNLSKAPRIAYEFSET